MIKIIAVDLDGTIFRHDQSFTNETIETLKELKNNGYIMVLNSGRIALNLLKVLEKFEITSCFDYILGANGSEFYNIKTKEFKILGLLDEEKIKNINTLFLKEDIALSLYEGEFFLTNKMTDFFKKRSEALKLNTKLVDFNCIDKKYTKVLGIINPDKKDYFEKRIKELKVEGVDSFFSNTFLIEFVSKGISKISGLDYILTILKEYTRENILSFGDSANDIEMLRHTNGVRMGKDNEALLEYTKYYTDICDENGFSNYINKNILNKK